MTSIGSPPNALSALSAALTTPACEHDEGTDAAAAHARREEALVEDQAIRHGVPVAHSVVSDEPRLVRRHALNLAADEEEARECVGLGVLRDAPEQERRHPRLARFCEPDNGRHIIDVVGELGSLN